MHHKEQVTAAIHQEIAYIIQRYIADPRLQNIAVTSVQLSKKLDYADVYITQLNACFTPSETGEGLQKATSKIRYHLARQRSHARQTPKLRFHYDTAFVQSIHLRQLINQTVS